MSHRLLVGGGPDGLGRGLPADNAHAGRRIFTDGQQQRDVQILQVHRESRRGEAGAEGSRAEEDPARH